MRKWIVIALIAVAVACVAMLLRRGTDSVAKLKEQYVAACYESLWSKKWVREWSRITRRPVNWRWRKRIEKAERRLGKAGLLEEKTFIITNYAFGLSTFIHSATQGRFMKFPKEHFGPMGLPNGTVFLSAAEPNEVIARIRLDGNKFSVVAPREEILRWEATVKDLDRAQWRSGK